MPELWAAKNSPLPSESLGGVHQGGSWSPGPGPLITGDLNSFPGPADAAREQRDPPRLRTAVPQG